jgi:hypothetical protein
LNNPELSVLVSLGPWFQINRSLREAEGNMMERDSGMHKIKKAEDVCQPAN